jgi:hypothetical protein
MLSSYGSATAKGRELSVDSLHREFIGIELAAQPASDLRILRVVTVLKHPYEILVSLYATAVLGWALAPTVHAEWITLSGYWWMKLFNQNGVLPVVSEIVDVGRFCTNC